MDKNIESFPGLMVKFNVLYAVTKKFTNKTRNQKFKVLKETTSLETPTATNCVITQITHKQWSLGIHTNMK